MVSENIYKTNSDMLTVDREPTEHNASLETTFDLVDPFVIEVHPPRTGLNTEMTRLHILPEVVRLHVSD